MFINLINILFKLSNCIDYKTIIFEYSSIINPKKIRINPIIINNKIYEINLKKSKDIMLSKS